MDLPASLLKGVNLKLLVSIAITGAIVAAFLLLGKASALSLDVVCPAAPVQQGNDVVCELNLTIRATERVPIENLVFVATGPGGTQVQATFDPFGAPISVDTAIREVTLISTRNLGLGYGYGYGGRSVQDEATGIGYNFDFGGGYGYGYAFAREQFRYRVVIDTTGIPTGNYSARFVLNTGSPDPASFESSAAPFTVVTGEVDTTPPSPAPSLVQPSSGLITNDSTPFFEWTPSSGDVVDYLLQVTSGGSFNPLPDIEVVIPHPGTGHLAVAPLNDATYQWRVVARDAALNTASSIVQPFTIDTLAPGIPLLLLPLNNSFIPTSTPFFQWQTTEDVHEYELRVTSEDIVAGPFDIQVFLPAPADRFQTPTGDALIDGTYQWRVIARDLAGNPQQYGIFTFTVDTLSPGSRRWWLRRITPS